MRTHNKYIVKLSGLAKTVLKLGNIFHSSFHIYIGKSEMGAYKEKTHEYQKHSVEAVDRRSRFIEQSGQPLVRESNSGQGTSIT